MFNWSSQPLSIVTTIFWAAFLTSALCFATDRWLHTMLKSHWKLILILLVLVVAWRLPMGGTFFHGLEYEDSYVYTVAGRQIFEHVGSASAEFPYSINVCAIGSLKSCQSWESFPEHFIGYPYVISLFSKMVGYTADVGSVVNLLAACLADILIFCIALFATDNVTMASAAALVFAITPVFAVYGLETSAEPASNVCISLVIWFYMRSISALGSSEGRWSKRMSWCAYTTVLLFSLTVKRENILLVVVLPLVLLFIANRRTAQRREQYKLIVFMLFSTALALILSVEMRLAQTALSEAALLKTFPLTAERLAIFVFGFARSFFVNRWYGGAIAAVALGIVVACRRRGLLLVPLFLFVTYFLLYALHVRSYYEMRSGYIEPGAALRFSMNLMSSWALLAGIGIGVVVMRLKGTHAYGAHKRLSIIMGASIFATFLSASFVMTNELRADAVEDEASVRIFPAHTAQVFASSSGQQPDYVVTLEPLVTQMYGSTTANVIDLAAVDANVLHAQIFSGERGRYVLLEETSRQTEADFTRYGGQIQYLHSLPESTLYDKDGFKIVLLGRP
jgi:hypothetical protein